MRITRTRPGVLTLVAADHELSTLAAGARMALSLMRADPDSPAEARESLRRTLGDYDRGVARAADEETANEDVLAEPRPLDPDDALTPGWDEFQAARARFLAGLSPARGAASEAF